MNRRLILQVIAAGLLALTAIVLIAQTLPPGVDWVTCFYPVARQSLDGEWFSYEQTGCVLYFPWTLLITTPFALFPVEMGNTLLVLASITMLTGACILYRRWQPFPFFAIALAVSSVHSFDVYLRGQLDAFNVLGVVIGAVAIHRRRLLWLSVGFALMMMKPPLNFALVGLLYLLALRAWPRADIARALSIPAVLVLLSFLGFGLDWPIRYLNNMNEPPYYLSITLWRGADLLGLPHWPIAVAAVIAIALVLRVGWRDGVTPATLALVASTNLLFSTYAPGDHYVLLIPAYLFVASRSRALALLAYALTWTPLLRLPLGYDAAVLDIGYTVLLWSASWWYYRAQSLPSSDAVRAAEATA